MANLSKDIQCAGLDTRPSMLDRTNFASWQQWIRLYCRGKENGVNILKSIDEGPYKIGTVRETLAESTKGTPQFGSERPRVYSNLSSEEKIDIWDNVKMLLEGYELTKEDRESQLLQLNSKFVNNMLPEWGRFVTVVKLNRGLRDSNYDQLFAYLKQHETHANENKMMLERFSQPTVDPLALFSNVSNPQHYSPSSSASSSIQVPPPLANSSSLAEYLIENLTTRWPCSPNHTEPFSLKPTINSEHLSMQGTKPQYKTAEWWFKMFKGDPIEVRGWIHEAEDCDAFDLDVDEAPTSQTMFIANLSLADLVTDEAGSSYDSDILSEVQDHDQYLDAACAHHEEHVMHDSVPLNNVVDLHADYTSVSNMTSYDQEQVELYERRAKFELTEREHKINEQLRIVISDRNFKEETFKKELHSLKLQLASTINHNKSMVEEAMFLKKDFKQKENKYPEDFLNMKSLKEKVEDKLIKQDQSLQTVHMLCRPRPHYNEVNKVDVGYKNPLCLTHAKQAQPALYNGHEILKDNHAPAKMHNIEDTLEIAEITRKKMNAKMTDPECVTHKALTKEIKEMKEVFEELEAKAVQYAVDRKHDAIERKNLIIVNDNLIIACLSQEVFSVAINSKLNVARFTEMHVANTTIEARCLALEAELANLRNNNHDNQKELINHFSKLKIIDSQITKLTDPVTNLQAQNDLFRAGNDKIKQHYKELYDSIKITRAKHIELVTKLTTENVNLKTSVSKDKVKPQVLTRAKHAIDVEPIIPRLRNNRDAHLDYLRHLKESVETIRDIVKEAKLAYIPLIRKKQVTIATPSDKSDRTTYKHVVTVETKKTNVPVPPSTGVNICPKASGSQPKSKPKLNRISPAKGVNKLPVEDQPRTNKSHLRTTNRVDSSSRLKRTVINSNLDSICQTCNKCLTSFDHDMCVATYLKSVVAPPFIRHNCNVRKVKQVWKPKQVRQVWKPTGKVLTTIGYQQRPTGRILNFGKQCPLTRFTPPKVVSAKQNKKWVGCSKHMTGDRSRLMNFVKKFIGTVRFRNDHFGAIMGYGDYVIGNSDISRVYYVEGLGHNLFSVGQFCYSDLEVAF
nr:hypothetical protein [Tanacetum cinerariifolium]